MKKEIEPEDTTRAAAYALWMKAPNPKNKNNEVSSCDIRQSADLIAFNQKYLKYTGKQARPMKHSWKRSALP